MDSRFRGCPLRGHSQIANVMVKIPTTLAPTSGARVVAGSGCQFRPFAKEVEGLRIGQGFHVLHRPPMDDVAHGQLDDLSRFGARDVLNLGDFRRHMTRRGVAADL